MFSALMQLYSWNHKANKIQFDNMNLNVMDNVLLKLNLYGWV